MFSIYTYKYLIIFRWINKHMCAKPIIYNSLNLHKIRSIRSEKLSMICDAHDLAREWKSPKSHYQIFRYSYKTKRYLRIPIWRPSAFQPVTGEINTKRRRKTSKSDPTKRNAQQKFGVPLLSNKTLRARSTDWNNCDYATPQSYRAL